MKSPSPSVSSASTPRSPTAPPSRDRRQLPVTVDMTDHGGVEKTRSPAVTALPGRSTRRRRPRRRRPRLLRPGNDLVLYYGDQAYYPGIVILGRLDETAAQRISAMNGSLSATIEASDG